MYPEDHWLLPEGIDELLPPTAWQLEQLRRGLLDLYHGWGYELVLPPFIEYLDSLLTGAGSDLDLRTFKLIDQLNGRTLGIRADMTPQVARIDAHGLQQQHPTRLCYVGTVLHTQGDGFGGSRAPIQVGAELYGHSGLASDLEIIALMLTTLERAGLHDIHLDLGHVAVFRGLISQAGLNTEQEALLFEILQRKALPELREQLDRRLRLSPELRRMLLALTDLNGGPEVLQRADRELAAANDEVHRALNTLQRASTVLQRQWPERPLHIDLAELRGYRYHTGLVFAAYMPGQGQELARGGRYDQIGEIFGRARPATGFSADLKKLLLLGQAAQQPDTESAPILAPTADDPALEQRIRTLRDSGHRVVRALPDSNTPTGCRHVLTRHQDGWHVMPMESSPVEHNRG